MTPTSLTRPHNARWVLALAAALLAVAAGPAAQAASSAASSASDSLTTSVGSLSGSIQQSSTSSARTVAEGDYRVERVAAVAERPGQVRLTLQPVGATPADAGFDLLLPAEALARTAVAAGGTVTAVQRPYGVEFAEGRPRTAFFLVLSDDWHRELRSTPVGL